MSLPDLKEFAPVGTEIPVRVTPRASRNRITIDGDPPLIRVYVTCVPEGGEGHGGCAGQSCRSTNFRFCEKLYSAAH